MNVDQRRRIPTQLLAQPGTGDLRAWLHARGWRMSLLELDNERRHRNLTTRKPQTKATKK